MVAVVLGIVIGSVLASYASALGYRIYKREAHTITHGRSKCLHCSEELAWSHLVPIVSFIMQKGRCAYCQKKIPVSYLIVELIGAVLGGMMVAGVTSASSLVSLFALLVILLAIVFIDINWQEIPDVLVVAAGVLVFLTILDSEGSIVSALLGAVLSGFVIWVIVRFSGGKAMGEGDIGLAVVLGALVGLSQSFWALALSFIIGGAVAAVLLAMKKVTLKTKIAFGPFLIIGFMIIYLWRVV